MARAKKICQNNLRKGGSIARTWIWNWLIPWGPRGLQRHVSADDQFTPGNSAELARYLKNDFNQVIKSCVKFMSGKALAPEK